MKLIDLIVKKKLSGFFKIKTDVKTVSILKRVIKNFCITQCERWARVRAGLRRLDFF